MTLLSRYWIRHFTKSLWWALLPLISVGLLYPNAIAQRHPVQPCLMHCQDGASLIPAQPDQPSAYLETKSAHPLDRTSGKDGPLLSLNASSYGFSLALLQWSLARLTRMLSLDRPDALKVMAVLL